MLRRGNGPGAGICPHVSSRNENGVVGKVSHREYLGFCSEQGDTTRDCNFYKVHQGNKILLSDRLVNESVCSYIHLFCLLLLRFVSIYAYLFYLHVTCMSGTPGGRKRTASYSQELELKMVVSYYVELGL